MPECEKCQHEERDHLVHRDKPPIVVQTVGRGSWKETRDHYECPTCGQWWELLRESGASGRGKFWNRIPSPTP